MAGGVGRKVDVYGLAQKYQGTYYFIYGLVNKGVDTVERMTQQFKVKY
jgi:hypothetical protein